MLNLGQKKYGIVACSMDDGLHREEFSRSDWEYLKVGIMVKMDDGELTHHSELDLI